VSFEPLTVIFEKVNFGFEVESFCLLDLSLHFGQFVVLLDVFVEFELILLELVHFVNDFIAVAGLEDTIHDAFRLFPV